MCAPTDGRRDRRTWIKLKTDIFWGVKMKENKPQRQPSIRFASLLLIFVVLLALALLIKESPLYYEKIVERLEGKNLFLDSKPQRISTKTEYNTESGIDVSNALKNGGNISFLYNYIPSSRAWDSMYSYSLYRYSPSGDCTFYCVKNTIENGSEDLCNCYYSETVWNELINLLMKDNHLVDRTSVYDANGLVVSTPISKTVSFANGIYTPSNIDEIEKFFKKLAINAGVEENELDDNLKINDAVVENRENINDLNGNFLINLCGGLSDEESQQLEEHLWAKYRETGLRMYVFLNNTDDTEKLKTIATKLNARATSPSIVFGLTASKKHWDIRLWIKNESAIKEGYRQIADAYYGENTLFDALIDAIDTAYKLY